METKKLYIRPLAEMFDVEEEELCINSDHNDSKSDSFFSESSYSAKSTPAIFTDPISSSSDEYSMQ